MSVANRAVPTLIEPKGIDKAIQDVNSVFSSLTWLDRAFGKADKLEKTQDGKRVRYPAVYSSSILKTQYINLLPDSHLGNFCWVDVEDGYDVDWIPNQESYQTATASWVFWYNIEKVYPVDSDQRSNRNVIDQVLNAMSKGKGVEVRRVYERGENIYKGYDISEVERKFLMRPYIGFRIETELRFLAC